MCILSSRLGVLKFQRHLMFTISTAHRSSSVLHYHRHIGRDCTCPDSSATPSPSNQDGQGARIGQDHTDQLLGPGHNDHRTFARQNPWHVGELFRDRRHPFLLSPRACQPHHQQNQQEVLWQRCEIRACLRLCELVYARAVKAVLTLFTLVILKQLHPLESSPSSNELMGELGLIFITSIAIDLPVSIFRFTWLKSINYNHSTCQLKTYPNRKAFC